MTRIRTPLGAARAPAREAAVSQSLFTIVAKADPLRIDSARAYLQSVNDAITLQAAPPFDTFAMLHFCSFTLFEDAQLGPRLVFESNIDGAPAAYLDALCSSAVAAPVLHTIFTFCLDYTLNGLDPRYLRRYFDDHLVSARTAFVGNVGRSARRIRDEAALVERLADYLDNVAPMLGPGEIAAEARRFIRDQAQYAWVWQRAPRLTRTQRLARWATALAFGGGVLAALLLPLSPHIAFLVALRRRERSDPSITVHPGADQLRTLAAREDRIVQNHLASLCYVKTGPFRRRLLKTVLFGANIVARISTRGKLLGLDSLHFAHWALIDNDSRLLFLTNYDGSWENYLDDFIERASLGLTAIWSNTFEFPRTCYLFFKGAKDERKFKAIVRKTQAYTNVWYSAYPALSVGAIENNTAICDGLSQTAGAFDAAAWLRRFK